MTTTSHTATGATGATGVSIYRTHLSHAPVGPPVITRIITNDTAWVNEARIRTITSHKVTRVLVLNGRLVRVRVRVGVRARVRVRVKVTFSSAPRRAQAHTDPTLAH